MQRFLFAAFSAGTKISELEASNKNQDRQGGARGRDQEVRSAAAAGGEIPLQTAGGGGKNRQRYGLGSRGGSLNRVRDGAVFGRERTFHPRR